MGNSRHSDRSTRGEMGELDLAAISFRSGSTSPATHDATHGNGHSSTFARSEGNQDLHASGASTHQASMRTRVGSL